MPKAPFSYVFGGKRAADINELDLSNGQLKQLPHEANAAMDEVSSINLFNNNISAFPERILECTNLVKIDLRSNLLRKIPPEIISLKKLEILLLDYNILQDLPDELSRLNIKEIHLNNNSFRSIPECITRMCDLNILKMNANGISDIDHRIFSMKNLKHLEFSRSNIKNINKRIKNARNLSYLDVSGNDLSYLPPEVGDLRELRALNISSNPISRLPAETSDLRSLQELVFDYTLLGVNYRNAYNQGIKGLFSYVRSLRQDTLKTYEAKLLITGEGGVGKTSTLTSLQSGPIRSSLEKDNTTWGVSVATVQLPHPEIKDCEVNLKVWDFGGQNIYRSTHQFFFSDHAIYLLVWNPRTDIESLRISNWLRTIALRTGSNLPLDAKPAAPPRPKAKVILVATHCEDEGGSYSADFGFETLDDDLQSMIVESVEIDNRTGRNIEHLKERIAFHAAGFPDMGAEISRLWFEARKATLEKSRDKPWISYDAYTEICSAAGITDIDEVRTLAGAFIHRLGHAIWYGSLKSKDSPDPMLDDTLVLDAEWLSRAFAQVLDDDVTKESGGILSNSRFPQIWTDHQRRGWRKYEPAEYPRIARMMRQFDVAIPTRNSNGDRSVVPELVP